MVVARWSFLYRIADYVFAVQGSDPTLQDLARGLYSATRTRCGPPSACFVLERQKDWFALLHNGVEICCSSCLAVFFREVEWALTEAIMAALGHYYQVHAGVVSQERRARLLIGHSDAGKTSLVLALAERGAVVFTDEVALIEPGGLQVVAFRRDLIVHRGSQGLFPELMQGADSPSFKNFDEYRYVSPLTIGLQQFQEKAAIVQLVFPVLRSGSQMALCSLGQAEAARRLLEQAFNLAHWGPRGTELTGRLVETCPSIELVFEDAREAADLILESEIQS